MASAAKTFPTPEARTYDIELSTLLGKRAGSLGLRISGAQFSGILRLMKAETPVHGHLLEDGMCRVSGSIRIRMNTYPFEGEGMLLPERIELLLRCAGLSLPLRGSRKEE